MLVGGILLSRLLIEQSTLFKCLGKCILMNVNDQVISMCE